MKKFEKKVLVVFILLACFIIIGFGIRLQMQEKEEAIKEKINFYIEIEKGTEITPRLFLKENAIFESFLIHINWRDITEIGEYKIPITLDSKDFEVTLVIKDSTPPELEVRDITIYEDETICSEDFITSIKDISSYQILPLNIEKKEGIQTVLIEVIDEYGNHTKAEAKLTIIKDVEAPIFSGLETIETEIQEKINLYNNVTAYDNRDGSVSFSVDDSNVNYNQPGWYTIFYSASDKSGNVTKKERKIHIKEKEITYQIQNFPTYKQYPDYPNGCESIALYTLLKYYKINVTPEQIVNKLQKGDGPYLEGGVLYGGNPEVEFVGDPRDPHGYGVYEEPIIDVANHFKSGIINYSGSSLDSVLELVKQGVPVQVWVSIDLKDTKVCVSWKDKKTSIKISWICDLHSVVIVGFNSHTVYVSDPYHGSIIGYNRTQFERIYNLFGKRAIYYKD